MPTDHQALESVVTELLSSTGQLIRRLRAVSNALELSWSQIAILARLEESGAMTIAELARAESVQPQSMGASVKYLKNLGLLESQSHPTDGRQILYFLSTHGVETRKSVRLAKREWLLQTLSQLSDEDIKILSASVNIIKRIGDV